MTTHNIIWMPVFIASLAALGGTGLHAASTITFDNQSSKDALVKLVGPTRKSVAVENGRKETVEAAAGRYLIKARYGEPGRFTYSKGDEFEVAETSTSYSQITITLHKVIGGNYGTREITENEFGLEEDAAVLPRAPTPPEASPSNSPETPSRSQVSDAKEQTVSLKSSAWSITITNLVAATWDEGESLGYYLHSGDSRAADSTPRSGVLARIAPKAGEKIVLIKAEITNSRKDPAEIEWQKICLRTQNGSTNILQVCKFLSDDMFWGPSKVTYSVLFPPSQAIKAQFFFIVPRDTKEVVFLFSTLSSAPIPLEGQKKSEK